ncbi:biotin-dependent carboxyltransferase family protein [Vibrio algivorus]|uniref:Allophanate hydrolase n=1 Tax=Vibrio algivorus TaxID=1667024 RepID=A0ABQ6ERZ1_9VIBR|nr:biotin-dependent carboxyltransferase family protein [Vibrio algivorus]GLT15390.1 allophanate hydrolase [Vibrio algivorus]
MTLRVINAGPLSLLQDTGRMGFQGVGAAVGGPMDEHAFHWANHLLGNDVNAAQIEITFGLFQCEFTHPTQMAMTGADMSAELDGKPLKPWASYYVEAGSILRCKTARQGMRAYLAIQHGFEVNQALDSCSTVVRDEIGGLHGGGEPLTKGDVIAYRAAEHDLLRQVPTEFIPHYPELAATTTPCILDMLPTYQYEQFSKTARQQFFNGTYTVSPNSDRMGYRLSGDRVEYDGEGLISEGIALGAIQIPSDGQPIVLMADHQTIGGYPKIGCLTRMSVSKLAQCPPGTKVRFQLVKREKAEQQYREMLRFFVGEVTTL